MVDACCFRNGRQPSDGLRSLGRCMYLATCSGEDFEHEPRQFCLDPPLTPQLVLSGHAADETPACAIGRRPALIADNIWLRKQLVVLHRRNPHPRSNNANRGFWILACRWLPAWRTSLLIVKPETVLRWHRQGWRTYWRRRSRRRRALGIAAVFRPKLLAALTQAFYHVNP